MMEAKIFKTNCQLYRYDYETGPDKWDPEYKSKLYMYEHQGESEAKNKIGAFFFFDKEEDMKVVCVNTYKSKYEKIDMLYPGTQFICTKAMIKEDIRLLDLTRYNKVCDMLFDIYNAFPEFYEKEGNSGIVFYNPYLGFGDAYPLYCQELNNKGERWFLSSLKDVLSKITMSGSDCCKEEFRACVAKKLYWGENVKDMSYICQQFTDFNNGYVFKEVLENYGYEGYVFNEAGATTCCLFDSLKLSLPKKSKIDVDFLNVVNVKDDPLACFEYKF